MKVMFCYNEKNQKHKHIHQVLLFKIFIKNKQFSKCEKLWGHFIFMQKKS